MTDAGPEVRRDVSLPDVVAEHARSFPDRVALVDGDVRLTWAAVDDRVARLAGGLAEVGFSAGDRLLWLGQNSFRLAELLLAVGRLRGLVCPVNWRLTAEEMHFVVDDLAPRVVVWQETEIGDVVRSLRGRVDGSVRWIRHDGDEDHGGLLGDARLAPRPDDVASDEPVVILYTAAFDGHPNGALLSHANLLAQGTTLARLFEIDHDFRFLVSGPLFHVGTFMWMCAVLAVAGTNVFLRRVHVPTICRLIEQERCNWAFLVPPTVTELIAHARNTGADLSSLRVGLYADLWDGLVEQSTTRGGRWPGGFGQTEVTGLATWAAIGAPGLGTHGRPPPGVQVQIVDSSGDELPPGQAGEIVVRGVTVGHGYWNRPHLNQYRSRGGWWHTEDLGRREADGSITFLGTAARMIKSGVENVYPVEVERCLVQHPEVEQAAVIGVPEPGFVQAVKAVVVPRDRADPPEADELIAHCRVTIASYKKPRHVAFVDTLPTTSSGQVDYDALDAAFGGGNYPGGDTPVEG